MDKKKFVRDFKKIISKKRPDKTYFVRVELNDITVFADNYVSYPNMKNYKEFENFLIALLLKHRVVGICELEDIKRLD